VQRERGSWLVDGGMSLERLRAEIGREEPLPGEADKGFHTVGGLVRHVLGRIPRAADTVEAARLSFAVVDMERQRVDRVPVRQVRESHAGR